MLVHKRFCRTLRYGSYGAGFWQIAESLRFVAVATKLSRLAGLKVLERSLNHV
jgi:hypothetical protein